MCVLYGQKRIAYSRLTVDPSLQAKLELYFFLQQMHFFLNDVSRITFIACSLLIDIKLVQNMHIIITMLHDICFIYALSIILMHSLY